MSRTRWIIACSWLLLFWLIAGAVWVPALQKKLESRAADLLSDVDGGHGPITVRFDGQQALLAGRVRHDYLSQEISKRVAEQVRVESWLSAGLNPVTAVRNDLEISPYPPGWLLLTVQGTRARLFGTAASEYEARDVSRLLQDRWGSQGGTLEPRLKTDFKRFDEATQIQSNLDRMPSPRKDIGGDSAQVHITRLGGAWERLTLETSDELLRQQLSSYPITDSDWDTTIKPALDQVRLHQKAERTRLAEAERQAKLPPPHVFLAARDQRLLARGEVASLRIKRELLNTIIGTFPTWRVLDDLRVNDQRREAAEFGPITTALLPSSEEGASGKSLALGLSGTAWKFVDWQVGAEARPWDELLPADLPPALLQEDSKMVTQWLQGSAQGIPSLPTPAQPSFLTLTLLPDKVILAGQLAEEALRARLIEATKRAYSAQAVIFSEALLARGTCEPTAEVEQTVRSLPPLPSGKEPPVIAFARPGQVWKAQPATETTLAPGGLTKSGLLPEGFPAAMAEDTLASEAYDHLRHYWQRAAAPAAPAPVLAPPAPVSPAQDNPTR